MKNFPTVAEFEKNASSRGQFQDVQSLVCLFANGSREVLVNLNDDWHSKITWATLVPQAQNTVPTKNFRV